MRGIDRFGLVICLCCSLGATVSLGAGSSSLLIDPGVRIGQVRIGEKLETVHHVLGKPSVQDAAMGGKLTEVWRYGLGNKAGGRKAELAVLFQGPGAGGDPRKPTVVVQIRVTSPYFKTASGISVNSSLAEIKKTYPHLQEDRSWEQSLPLASDKQPKEGFVDRDAGIAFEFRAGASANPEQHDSCVAIHVFHSGGSAVPIGSFDE
jgi:hypothetical protein